MEIKNVLVTGSDGYIGSILVDKLIKRKYQVVGLDALFFKDALLGPYGQKCDLIKKDIRNLEGLDFSNFDVLIHLAALPNDPLGRIKPEFTEEINYLATVNLAKKAKKAGVRRFVFSSSCSIYGLSNGIASERSKPNPLTIYAQSKRLAEKELVKLADKNFCVAILRNSTVHGFSPKFRSDLVVNSLTAWALVNGKIGVKSDGTPWRPFIDVRDLSEAFIEFLKIESKKINGKIINVGFNDNNFQVKDIIKEVQNQLPDCEVIYTGEHAGDTRSYQVSFDKFRRIFSGFERKWSLAKSINDLIKELGKWRFSQGGFDSGRYNRVDVLEKIKNLSELR